MEAFLRDYRDRHLGAGQWAAGSSTVRHNEETQGRIFRMAEQIRIASDWPNPGPLFNMLAVLDETVDGETDLKARPSAASAAAAALAGYKILFGTREPLEGRDWPVGFSAVEEGEVELATIGLRAKGFDPIVIDGLDPAAFLWALYEMDERLSACDEVIRLDEHPAMPPRCIAVVPQVPLRRVALTVIPAEAATELAGVAG